MAAIFDSDSDTSDFSGFSPSDIGSEFDLSSSDDESLGDESGTDEPRIVVDDNWTDQFTPPTIGEFREVPGPNLPDDFDTMSATPLEYFWKLFPLDLLQLLVTMTNSYAKWKKERPGNEKDDGWYDVTMEEMRAFLGINILMGINVLPQTQLYWSTNQFIGNSAIAMTLSCRRFQQIMKYLHCTDRSTEPARGQPGYSKTFKVQPIIDRVSETFREFYTHAREISIDEAMIAFAGRLSYRQYMPAKPIKRGIKIWMCCDAKSAYLSRFSIYLGKETDNTGKGLGHNVVMKLTEHLRQSQRFVFFDNFFTSIPLMKDLLDVGLYSCGTVRMNRKGFPKTLKKPAGVRNRGDFKVLQMVDSNLTASAWKDKKLVYHLSTLSDAEMVLPAQRRSGADILQLNQPHSVKSYNQFMGGVDLHDQYRMNYQVGRKGKKPWRYIFWFLLNCSIVNAFILYDAVSSRILRRKRYTHLDFRMELVKELIGGFKKRKRPLPDSDSPALVVQRNLSGHINSRMPGLKRKCKYHTRVLKARRETVYGCAVCNVHLCPDGCHARFHNS